ncbi:aspartate-semialdehyde dehydrogenase [Streptomyces sp. WZ.A104]|uniref:aspartate-semialdehyde dehydrogenase n=1 Tax=Streptomyces sp. WZ.A104 TaxID=2023771 RepID=UPI00211CF18C|nr:aspartate-semialdehyde dehydrogenase [Streptomyces sp. WZ.A104]
MPMPLVDDPLAPRIAVVGATGAVGGTLLDVIEDRGLRYRALHLLASARSAGREIRVGDREYRVGELTGFHFGDADVVFFSAGHAVSRAWVPVAVAHGTLVIDNTFAFRMSADVPLVVPQVNSAELDRRPAAGVIANPNSVTIPLVRVVQDVERRWGVRQISVSTYQAASGSGHSGIEELQEASRLALQDPQATMPAEEFSPGLAFNVVPQIGRVLDDGFTLQERKLLQESRKILGLPGLDITATCVRVPVVNGHSAAMWVECLKPVDRAELCLLLGGLPDVTVHGDGMHGDILTPATLGDPNHLHLGRIRISPTNPNSFLLWLVTDNLRVGAALNALQIMETLVAKGHL